MYTPKYFPRQSLELSIALTQLPRAGIIGMHPHTILSYCFLKDILLLLYKNLHNNSTDVMYTARKKTRNVDTCLRGDWVDVEADRSLGKRFLTTVTSIRRKKFLSSFQCL